jgi:NitT/TauT family transport system substrate-binding protein
MTRVALMWFIQAQFAGYFLAQRDVPELDFVPRSFEHSPVELVRRGDAEFGVVSPAQLLAAGSAADDLVLLALVMDRSPLVLVGLRERVGDDLAGLERPRVGIWEGEDVEIRAMLVRAGVASDRTTFVPIGDELAPLFEGEVDFLQATVYEELPRLVAAGASPDALVVHHPLDYRLRVAKDGFVTRRKVLETQPSLVFAVTRGVVRGWLDAIREPDAAVDAVLALRPELDTRLQHAQLQRVLELITPTRPLGVPDPAAVGDAVEAFDVAGLMLASRSVAVEQAPWNAAAEALAFAVPAP